MMIKFELIVENIINYTNRKNCHNIFEKTSHKFFI